jgi:transcriptional regulator with XRE-family HTH domain
MQAVSVIFWTGFTMPDMQVGRPSKRPRTSFGERLFAARTAAGLSQAEVAEKLGLTQTAYAFWERHPVALRPEQVEELTEILGISVEQLFVGNGRGKERGGPVGKMRRLFEAASELPRSQQQKVVALLDAFVKQHHTGNKTS